MMKTAWIVALALLLAVPAGAEPCRNADELCIIVAEGRGGLGAYGWTVSASTTDPFQNTTSATNDLATYYLWYYCADQWQATGLAAAEFDLLTTGAVHLATLPQNGFLNAGGITDLLLAVGGCPAGPVVAANLLMLGFEGSVCFTPAANGNLVGVDCEPNPQLWPINWIGLEIQGPISVDGSSWGNVKQRYR